MVSNIRKIPQATFGWEPRPGSAGTPGSALETQGLVWHHGTMGFAVNKSILNQFVASSVDRLDWWGVTDDFFKKILWFPD